jgi:hypothetical protein
MFKIMKMSLFILLVILASLLLTSAIPTRLVRLTLINKSDYDVFIRLRGSPVTNAFYYLTIPKGSRDNPTVKVFTVMADSYKRLTWQCNGLRAAGELFIDGNTRLTFLPCGEFECSRYSHTHQWWGCTNRPVTVFHTHRSAGEPRMEKVTFFKYVAIHHSDQPVRIRASFYAYENFGCITWWLVIGTYKLPIGCAFRYQY